MAEVVKVPVLGNVKTPWLYAGGAAVAGIVGYAWWTRATVVEDETVAVELPATEYTPPTVVDSGISVGGSAQQGEPIARTNIEWRNMAQAEGEALGFTQAVMQSALTKYLGKQRLNPAELAAMMAVVAILGEPPTGRPYSLLAEPITPPPTHTPTKPGAVTGLRYLGKAGPDKQQLAWNATPDATGYVVQYAGPGGFGPEWPESKTSHTAFLASGPTYTYDVWAVNAQGAGPKARIVFDT